MRVLVLFGSTSDKSIYEPLCEDLKNKDQEVDFEVISAHRNANQLVERLAKNDYDVVLGGAGLAAHLPGVIASKVQTPVFGVPVSANFAGLDALFSIMQMPFGVPVLSTAPNNTGVVGDFIGKMEAFLKSENKREVNLVVDDGSKNYEYMDLELKRTMEFAEENGISLRSSHGPDNDSLNIVLSHDDDFVFTDIETHGLCIHTPTLDAQTKKNPCGAINVFERITKSGGLWVGVNNTRNALISYLKFFKGEKR